ncbi:aminodeoxychorismate lyase [Psychromicrobium lacuslunae]|uniref:Endolytic murein transglycosylase n=1 Tax=Psychromicrobium lacuslunae TaxID=1618207 RepID=A0A0D4C2G7_9MICC|nr:aminodeoxychorismate lyase [Psychromicrobium lacuslunae]
MEHFEQDHDQSRRLARTSRKVRRRRRTVIFILILAAFVAAGYFAVQAISPMLDFNTAKDYPGPGGPEVVYTLPEGASARTVASELVAKKVVASENAFLNALKAANGESALLPGVYPLKEEMKAADAVSVLLAASQQKVHYAPIKQNLRQGEVFDALAAATDIPVAEFTALAKDPAAFGLPATAPSLEGYLAPGQYQFAIDLTAKEILSQMVQKTKEELVKAGVTDAKEQYRVLTIASIIEAEGNEANYAKISGAIENRLKNTSAETRGLLQSDATVAYGLGLKTYNISNTQKLDKKNKYNTFANPGLPIGPIGSPTNAAIVAAAKPEANNYYYWVTVNLDTGETLYATTFAQHEQNVTKYQAWCKANAGKCQ